MSRIVAAALVSVAVAAAESVTCVPEIERIRVMKGRAVESTTSPGASPEVSATVIVCDPEVVVIVL
jgi:hypothetical protein